MNANNIINVQYTLGNCVYNISETEEVHMKLQSDAEYLNAYFSTCTSSPELVSIITENESTQKGNTGSAKFKWNDRSTKFFLKSYLDKKDQFRDPKIKKKGLWFGMLEEMRSAGFQVEGEEMLDRKMRNLRKTFKTLKDNNNKSSTGEKYHVYSDLPHAGSSSIIKLREKRQTPTDVKNKYLSVTQNVSDSQTLPPQPTTPQNLLNASVGGATLRNDTDSSMVVPYSASDRPLLGVNGTGQLKDTTINNPTKTTIVSDPIQTTTNDSSKYPKKVLTSAAIGATAVVAGAVIPPPETSEEEVVDNIDVPEDETLTALKNRNYTADQSDYHNYYNSSMYVDKVQADEIWKVIKNITHNSMLSQSHRRAMTVELSFDFPFYGYPVRNVTVATGGFLYTGEYVHSWLAATQYIAPLMANFDTSLANDSFVRLNDNGTAFTVIWENVSLQDKQDVGKFTFSTTLHKNGDIVFTYFNVPILVHSIQDDKHPVKVGLSDAYIIDKIVYFARRKTIYEYHRVNFASFDITNSTIIYLKALPTCLSYNDCASCVNHDTTFDCAWCPILNRCSTGTDRRKQEWLHKGCDRTQISNITACPALGERGNNADQNKTSSTQPTNSNQSNSNQNTGSPHQLHPSEDGTSTVTATNSQPLNKGSMVGIVENPEPKSVGLAFGLLAPLCLIATFLLWILYAYRNPHTKSGQLLIQYRPSQWSWRRGEARYTAATIHM